MHTKDDQRLHLQGCTCRSVSSWPRRSLSAERSGCPYRFAAYTHSDEKGIPDSQRSAGLSGYDYASSLSTGNALRGNTVFAAHADSLSVCNRRNEEEPAACINMASFGGPATVVPLPPAAMLMVSGLAMLGGMAARRKRTAGEAA